MSRTIRHGLCAAAAGIALAGSGLAASAAGAAGAALRAPAVTGRTVPVTAYVVNKFDGTVRSRRASQSLRS